MVRKKNVSTAPGEYAATQAPWVRVTIRRGIPELLPQPRCVTLKGPMPEFCSCGAQLPPDAVFCHKCGKPQREIAAVEPEPVSETPAPFVAVEQAPPQDGFSGRIAMRLALPVAFAATLLFFLPFVNWLGAGFFTVFWYRRRTGERLNVRSGMRIGWITGLFMFGMIAVLLGGSAAILHSIGGVAAVQAQFKNSLDANGIEALKMIENETSKALFIYFITINLMSMAGGALGAVLPGRDQ
jgi:hypothetical protein